MFRSTSLFRLESLVSVASGGGAALTLFLISALVSISVAYDPTLSWPMLLTLLGSAGLYLVIGHAPLSPRYVIVGLVATASVLALYFVTQYAHFDYQGEVGLLPQVGRMTGSLMPDLVFFTPHPNAVAGFLEGVLLLSLTMTWYGKGRWSWVIAALLITYGLLITDSRGAWFGVAVTIALWLSLRSQGRDLSWFGAVFGLSLGICAGIFSLAKLTAFAQSTPILSSWLETSDSRLTLYQNSLSLLGDYPFTGIGLGQTFTMVYSRYQLLIDVPFLSYAHNLFLSVGLGQGLLGLVALTWLLIHYYYFVVRVERAGLAEPSLSLFRAAWLGTTAILLHGLTDSVQFSEARWTMPMPFMLAGLSVAIGLPALAQARLKTVERVSSNRRLYKPAIILVTMLVFLSGVSIFFWRPLASAWYANLGAVYQTRAELSPNLDDAGRELARARAVTHLERSLQLNPLQPVANRRLGLMALDRQDFETAVTYLERAYLKEAHNQATLKGLGYAYLWTGRPDKAEQLFRLVTFRSGLVDELTYWQWWWVTQNREDLVTFSAEMLHRLSIDR